MSHVVAIRTKAQDPSAIAAACARLNLAPPAQGTAELFSGKATGLIVQLPGWQYPVVIETESGVVHYDNFGGAWGSQRELDRLLQFYAIEKCRLEARKQGHHVTETALEDGSVKLQIVEGL
ncbi:MAG: DUF1257 domain-containing protein [Gemmataceae bacterium]|nr:DUF1257 domain-containing protein [Gemmataceae bacterium]